MNRSVKASFISMALAAFVLLLALVATAACVFDGKAGPYAEDAPPAPLSVYGRSKWAAEQALQEIVEPVLILRTTGVFGWDLNSKNFAMQVYHRVRAKERMTIPLD